MGLARFLRKDQIKSLYHPFAIESIEKTSTTLDNMTHTLSMWNIICYKESI
jgi:hypothetical protein